MRDIILYYFLQGQKFTYTKSSTVISGVLGAPKYKLYQ